MLRDVFVCSGCDAASGFRLDQSAEFEALYKPI
jgi:hypothetical protein